MLRSRARHAAALAVACGVALISPPALADERTDARREFKAGMEFVTQGRYDEGIEHFERAYDLLPHPNVLYNIGMAHARAGRPEEAIGYLEQYRDTVPERDAQQVDALIRSLRAESNQTVAAPAVAPVTTPTPGAPMTAAERSATIEAAVRELRQMADEQNDPALSAQADRLEEMLAGRTTAPAEGEGQSEPEPSEEPTPAPAQQPPAAPSKASAAATALASETNEAGEQTGLYEESVVSASRFKQSPLDAPNATAIITAQDIRMTGAQTLSQLLRRVAGVEVNTFNPTHSEISIRGLNRRGSNKVLLLWDGRQIRKDYLGSQWIDQVAILPDDIERIEIIRGPASALYGADAFTGVINIVTRTPGEGGSYAVGRIGNHGQYQGGASFSRRDGSLRYRASVGYTQANSSGRTAGPDRVDIESYNTQRPDIASRTLFANGDVNYAYAEKGALSVGGNYGQGDRTLGGLGRLQQTVSTNAFEAQAYGTLTTPVGVRLSANYDHVYGIANSSWVARDSVNTKPGLTLQRLVDVDLSWGDTVQLLVPQTITLGVSYRFKHIDWEWLDQVHTQHHFGVYLQDVIQLAKSLRLQIGARLDRHPLLNQLQFSPRGSLVYRFLGSQSLRLSGGRAFRGPSLMESYLQYQNETTRRAVSAWGLGNPDLLPESITSIELGYQNQASDHFSLEANVYHNWISDIMLLTDIKGYTLGDYAGANPLAAFDRDVQAFPISGLRFANERATSRQIGGELGLRLFPVEGLDFYVNYSVHKTSPLDDTKVDPVRANEQQTSLHKVNAGIQFRAKFGLETAVDVSWFSDQLWIEQVSDARVGVRWQEYEQPAFLMLSARVGYRLYDRLELGVSGTNLTFEHKRQHPLGLPLDTRILATAKVRFQ